MRLKPTSQTVVWKVVLPVDLALKVNQICSDASGKTIYGARSALIRSLLIGYLKKLEDLNRIEKF